MSGRNKKLFRKRHFISLELKIQILDRLKRGERLSRVAKTLNLNEATIRTIQKSEQKIRASVTAGCSISANMTARPREPIIEKMEKALNIWIDDCLKKRIPISTNTIKQKSLKIYNYLRENGEQSTSRNFVASKGWFQRFKKRYALQKIQIQGETDNETAKFPKELQRIIERDGFTTHQVFNAGETCLWWKKMPKRTFISKEEDTALGFKASKDCLTLLMCSNASGDHIVKPMLVYKFFNPPVMNNLNKSAFPVYWYNKKTWITADLFKKWFRNYFVPNVEKYLKQKNLDFKVLLILDNSPSHPKNLNHPNVKIIFLPPNTTPLLQPLDQGIIATFKTHYIKHLLQWVVNKIDDESIEVIQAWKLFTILDCINLISLSIKEIKPLTLNACWKNLWPESVQSFKIIDPAENRIEAILKLAKSLGGEGFDDMNLEDIEELMEEEIDETNLVEMVSTLDQINSEDDSTDENPEDHNFTVDSTDENPEDHNFTVDSTDENSEDHKFIVDTTDETPEDHKFIVDTTDETPEDHKFIVETTDEHPEDHNFTLESIREGINLAEQLELYFLNTDPSIERSITFKRELQKCMAQYNEIYKDLLGRRNQTEIPEFMIEIKTENVTDISDED
ncbi:tigger transposable element-derived protein 1-like [Centruroides vittatus]|uniref:tigger transposable element-derived protein 1-like n=1 Tax=Centruroides vittatus TaxID=120091 RepID=UPI00350F4996